MLAGIIPAPSAWAPRENPDAAEDRRQLVLDKMLQQGYITDSQHYEAMPRAGVSTWRPAPLRLPASPSSTRRSRTNRSIRRSSTTCSATCSLKYGPAKVYQGGLRVQTTLDPQIQQAADQSVQNGLKGTKEPLEMALATVEPQTGFVDALVGGREFGGQGPYSATQLRPRRLRAAAGGLGAGRRDGRLLGRATPSPEAGVAANRARPGSRSCWPPPSPRVSRRARCTRRRSVFTIPELQAHADQCLHHLQQRGRGRREQRHPPRHLVLDQHRLRPAGPRCRVLADGRHGQEARHHVGLVQLTGPHLQRGLRAG